MDKEKYPFGMIGLGVRGRNLMLNMGDHDFAVIGYDKNPRSVRQLNQDAGERRISAVSNFAKFIRALQIPRTILLMIPEGPVVDTIIADLLQTLEPNDLIIDGSNSHYQDTELRQKTLMERKILYLGAGISGGEKEVRHGPSIMIGGSRKAYRRVKHVFEAISAKVDGEPCVTYLGPKASGHYINMVHNGIEHSLMQLISETYDLMKSGLGLGDEQLHQVYQWWNQMELNSYLMEITAKIFSEADSRTEKRLLEAILEGTKQKGTGQWASAEAMDLRVPVPNIDIAIAMRNLFHFKDRHQVSSEMLPRIDTSFEGDQQHFVDTLRMALYAATIITYAQGMALLQAASDAYRYALDLESIARAWRGGCIIQAALLQEICMAYKSQPELPNLLFDPQLGQDVLRLREDLEMVVRTAAQLGIPAPGFMVALAYLDGHRSAWSPANLAQA
jgi:6-phosphogluconate dehydrogenase